MSLYKIIAKKRSTCPVDSRKVEIIMDSKYIRGRKQLIQANRTDVITKLESVVNKIKNHIPLSPNMKPHKLEGKPARWECHITGDVLLTWKFVDQKLYVELHLLDLTTHKRL